MPTLFLVRHGENHANLTKEFSYKHVDYSLTEKGRLQAQQTAAFFTDLAITHIYSSPLKRAYETAETLEQHLHLSPIYVREAFREINVGRLEGQRVSKALWAQYLAITTAWERGETSRAFPGGEDYEHLFSRMHGELMNIYATQPHHARIIIVGHGGIFNATICGLCANISYEELARIENQNCSITEIDWSGEQRLVRSWARSDHLSGKAAEFVPGRLGGDFTA